MKKFITWFVAISIALVPLFAEARAGSSFSSSRSSSSFSSRSYSYSSPSPTRSYSYSNSSVGSKGSNTYSSSPTYQPITKSVTPPSSSSTTKTVSSSTPSYSTSPTYSNPAPVYAAPSPAPSSGGGFWSSFAGGAAGAATANMLMNHNNGTTVVTGGSVGTPMMGGNGVVVQPQGYTTGGDGFMTFLVFMFYVAVILFIIFIIYKLVARKKTKTEYNPMIEEISMPRNRYFAQVDYEAMRIKPEYQNNVQVSKSDKEEFKQLVTRIQRAWSNRNQFALKTATTQEMYEHFLEIIDHNTRQGVINRVEEVTGIECGVLEVWEETSGKYATCIMRWKAHDFTTDLDGNVLDNGVNEYVRETWTFVKDGSHAWVLSAVQQMAD